MLNLRLDFGIWVRRIAFALFCVLGITALLTGCGRAAHAQKPPKIDSLLVTLPMPREQAASAVVAAFSQAGLGITNTTPFLIEADQGSTGAWSTEHHRVVRAVLTNPDSAHTNVLIVGTEVVTEREVRIGRRVYSGRGNILSQKRIDNRAGGNGGKVWGMMVDAAWMLDSTAVPIEALPKEEP